jgi:hypothetical protein
VQLIAEVDALHQHCQFVETIGPLAQHLQVQVELGGGLERQQAQGDGGNPAAKANQRSGANSWGRCSRRTPAPWAQGSSAPRGIKPAKVLRNILRRAPKQRLSRLSNFLANSGSRLSARGFKQITSDITFGGG